MSTRDNWSFDKVFNDDDFIAAGQLVIPPKGRKPSKQAKDNTYASIHDKHCPLLLMSLLSGLLRY